MAKWSGQQTYDKKVLVFNIIYKYSSNIFLDHTNGRVLKEKLYTHRLT